MSNTKPTLIPYENSNGVGISTVGFNTITKDAFVSLAVGFNTANIFPFVVGDKVMIENVSIGIGSTGKGYNSADWDYKLFTVNAVDANLGGIGGTITYDATNYVGWGSASTNSNIVIEPGQWRLINYGEDLIALVHNKKMFKWEPSIPNLDVRATPITGTEVPTASRDLVLSLSLIHI